MNLAILREFGTWFRRRYDKIVAVLLFVALCFSLLYLAFKIGMTREEQEEHERKIESFTPTHPQAMPVDDAPYEAALAKLEAPFQVPAWSNAVFVPEARVWCIDCRMPIPWAAEVCPFCTAKQPKPRESDPLWDYDRDGIPDLWERKYGLDPTDPNDVYNDNDGDGFNNLVEFRADPQTDLKDLSKKQGTDMNDPNDYPPPENLIVLKDIAGDPFDLRFRGKIKLPDNSLKFQLNVRGAERTIWARMGDTVEGFTLVDYKEKLVKKQRGGMLMTVDESVLTLKRGDKLIPLQLDQLVPYTEYTADLEFSLDGSLYPKLRVDSVFNVKDRQYKVKDIDSRKDVVVIIRVSDGKQFVVGKAPLKSPTGGVGQSLSPASVPAGW